MAKWKDKLTKKEREHLTDMGIRTLAGFKRTAEHQAKWRKDDPGAQFEPCWTCRSICNKLGIDINKIGNKQC